MTKQLLFSVSVKDCEVQAFKGSGPGGQKRNKTASAIRVIHHQSGAIGQASDAREQHLNKRNAFLRMIETKEFKSWHKVTVAKLCGILPKESLEEQVDKMMSEENLKIEYKINGEWIDEETK